MSAEKRGYENFVDPKILVKRSLLAEEHKQELKAKGYIQVEPDLLQDPNDIVGVKIHNWATEPFPKPNIDATKALLQSMYDDPANTLKLILECHNGFEESFKANTDGLITTITGAKTNNNRAFITIPDNIVVIYTSPQETLNSSLSNLNNEVVGTILDKTYHEKIVKAVATGNVDKLFNWEVQSQSNEILPENKKCIIGCGVSPNSKLSFMVDDPGKPVGWRSGIFSSDVPDRNRRSLRPASSETPSRHTIPLASKTSIGNLSIGHDPLQYTLNHEFQLLGSTADAIKTENKLLKYLNENNGDIMLVDFLKEIKPVIGNRKCIIFIDACSAFDFNCVSNSPRGIVNIPIDKKDDKNLYNYAQFLVESNGNPDPDIKEAYDQYFEASDKFKLNIKSTVFKNLSLYDNHSPLRPIYDIRYSPIVGLATRCIIGAFDAIRKNYLDNCVKPREPFDMGTMPKLKLFYEIHSAVGEQPNDDELLVSHTQTEQDYLSTIESTGDFDVSSKTIISSGSNSNSSSNSISEAIVKEPTWRQRLNNKIKEIKDNLIQIGQSIRSYFKQNPDNRVTITEGKISEDDGPFLPDKAGGGSFEAGGGSFEAGGGSFEAGGGSFEAGGGSFEAGGGSFEAGGRSYKKANWFPDVSAEEQRISSMMSEGKGGSRRRPRNKAKNRKTKKNKKQRKTKNRKNRQNNRNKTRRY
jgi:hypothetical protein